MRIPRKRDTKGLLAEGKLEQSRLRERERESGCQALDCI